MIRQIAGSVITLLVLATGWALFSATPVDAALEKYSWVSYDRIGASHGVYNYAGESEGGAATLEFVQEMDNPLRFAATEVGDTCESTLILTLDEPGRRGTLSSTGPCDLLTGADLEVEVLSPNIAEVATQSEADALKDSYLKQACEANQDTTSIGDCTTQASEQYDTIAATCKSDNDFEDRAYKGNAYLDCIAQALDVERPGDVEEVVANEEPPSCTIPEFGWVVCQLIDFFSGITDFTFNLLDDLLEIDPLTSELGSGNQSTTYGAWINFRNLANVLFVLFFLAIIYSQLTGWQQSRLSITRMLPRLVVVVILVNISYFVVSVAVDLSNIVGKSMQSTLVDVADNSVRSASSSYSSWTSVSDRVISITPTDEEYIKENMSPEEREQFEADKEARAEANPDDADLDVIATQAVINGVTLTGTVVMFANLAALVPIMLMALFAMVVTLLVLLLRQALIIVLVVIAPIAFALYLLPNTQQWFNKWKSTFVTLLMLYPAIAVVFGGSYLASQIIRETAEQNGQTLLAIFSLGIQVIPLFVTPLLMKLGGGVLNRFGGIVNNKNKGPYDRTMKAAQGWRQDRKVMQQTRAANRGIGGLENSKLMNKIDGDGKARKALKKANRFNPYAAAQRAKARNDARVTQHQDNLNRATTRLADSDPDAVARAATGLGGSDLREAVKQQISQQADQLERAGASAASVLIGDKTEEEALQMVTSGKDAHGKDISSEMRTAAAQKVAGSRNVENINKMLEQLNRTSGQFSDSQRHAIIDTIESSGAGSLAPHLQSSNLGAVRDGSLQNVGELYGSAAQQGLYSPDAISGMHESGIDGLAAAHRNGYINGDQMQQVKRNYAFATRNDKFNQNLSNATKERMNML